PGRGRAGGHLRLPREARPAVDRPVAPGVRGEGARRHHLQVARLRAFAAARPAYRWHDTDLEVVAPGPLSPQSSALRRRAKTVRIRPAPANLAQSLAVIAPLAPAPGRRPAATS